MSKIKIFALGGLNEYGKNMYVIEVNEDLFVFDAGLKYADEKLFGIDYVIPDFSYLKKNIEKVKGIFLTRGHDENIGALSEIIKLVPDLPIYGSKFTIDIVKDMFQEENVKGNQLKVIEPHQRLTFGQNSVFSIGMSHSIPGSLAYVLYTPDGAIVYTGCFVFDPTMMGAFKTDIGKLAYVGKQGVLCLLSESTYANRIGFTSPQHRISDFIREVLYNAENRIIVNVLSNNVYRINELCKEIMKTDRKLVIMGKYLQHLISYLIDEKYIELDNNRIGDLTNINDSNVIILISSDFEKPFASLSRISNGYDKYIKLKNTDTILFLEVIHDTMERSAVKVIDYISKMGAEVITLSSKKHFDHHASSEDLLLMLDLMNPKYYIPVMGQYRHQVANAKLATSSRMSEDHVLLLLNGDVAAFDHGVLQQPIQHIELEDIMIDGKSSSDIGELVLKDREMLSDNGIVIISTTLDRKTKEVLAGPEVITRGFIYVKDNSEVISEIQKIALECIKEHAIGPHIEFNKVKNQVRENVGKYIYKQTECKPMIISVILEI